MSRTARAAWPALTIAAGLLTSIAVPTVVSGGSSVLLVVRAAVLLLLLLAVAGVLGAIAVSTDAQVQEARRSRLLDAAAIAAAVWTVAAAVTAFLLYLEQAPALDSPAFGPGLVTFVADVAVGRTWLLAAAAAAVLTALLVAVRSSRGVVVLALLSAAAVVPLALQQAMVGAPVAVERSIASAAFLQLLALLTWSGSAVVGPTPRALRPICFAVVGLGTAVVWPDLVAEGMTGPGVVAAGAVLLVAGALAVASAVARLPRAVQGIEVALLGAALGLGVAGAVTRTAPPVPARTTPAEILTGSALPAPSSIGALVGTWRPDPLWAVASAVLLVGYLVVLRRGRMPWARARTASWVAGTAVLAWVTSGGPARYQEVDLPVHLAQHLVLLLLVPVLLAGGAPARLLAGARPRREPLVRPVTALLLAVLAVGGLYGTAALRWSVADPVGAELAVAACSGVGCLLVQALGRPGRFRSSAIVCALVLLVAETGGAVLLGTGSALLAPDWFGAMGWGTDALAAQRAGALAAWPVAAVPTVLLLIAAVRSPRPATAALSRRVAVAS